MRLKSWWMALSCLVCCNAFAASGGLADALANLKANAAMSRSDALLIQRDGKTLLETRSTAAAQPIELMSATKSVVALSIGLLLHSGALESLDQPVSAIYPEWAQGRKRDITVRMLLNHTSGLQNVPNAGIELEGAPDLVKLALAAELSTDPGSTFSYNNKATNLLAGIVERVSGKTMDHVVESGLFQPLGITDYTWRKDDAGTPIGMAGLALSAADMAKLGRLILDKGVAPDGRRLLGEAFVAELVAESARSKEVGLLWWRIPAWERFTLKPDAASVLSGKGVDAGVAAGLLKAGTRRFASKGELFAFFGDSLGPSWADAYGREITSRGIKLTDLFDQVRGPVVAYAAMGYMGQYLVVVPETSLVGVRQIARREAHDFAVDDFATFAADLLALSKAL